MTKNQLTNLSDFANAWEVDDRTVKNWVTYVYQAFEIILPAAGPFPAWAVRLLELTAKHISKKANLYYAETGETKRLTSVQYVQKIRSLRLAGHFKEFDQFRNFQKSQNYQPADNGDEALAGLGEITQNIDSEFDQAQAAVSSYEDKKVDEFIEFVDAAPQRILGKLSQRLQQNRYNTGIGDVVDVAYNRLPSAEESEIPEVLEIPALRGEA